MIAIKEICENPLVFKESDGLYDEIINEINRSVDKINPELFRFNSYDGRIIQEEFRQIYPIKNLFIENDNIKKLIITFAIKKIPLFLKQLKESLKDDKYLLIDSNQLRYSLRVRIFEDLEGYSLQPHKDSSDTVFSFILHLSQNNPKTNIYRTNKELIINISEDVSRTKTNQLFIRVIKQLNPGYDIKKSHAQFEENIGAWINNKYYNYKMIDDVRMSILELDELSLDVKHGDIYGLHNVKSGMIQTSYYDNYNYESYHGVHPTSANKRRLLIMDLIAQPVKNVEQLLILKGVNEDINGYYIIFTTKTCEMLTTCLV